MYGIDRVTEFRITNTKSYVPVVTLSSKDNVKLVKRLEEGFIRSCTNGKWVSNIKYGQKI